MNKHIDIQKVMVVEATTFLEAIHLLNETSSQVLFIVDGHGSLKGTLTDGDIRRAIIGGVELSAPIRGYYNPNPISLTACSLDKAKELMEEYGITRIPVVDADRVPISFISFEDVLHCEMNVERLPNKVVIMAGGRGSRLDPITKIIPKPLLPIGDKPMLELIMESFGACGFHEFRLSINYRKDFIKTWISERNDLPYNIACVEEEKPLGTAGSLGCMRGELTESFFVSNCDILMDMNYASALAFHREHGCAFTIVGALMKVNVPYGVLQLENGEFARIEEKPDVPMIINSGVYILEPECVSLIEHGEIIDMPDLIERVRESGRKVGVFPVHRKWIDIGQWAAYKQIINDHS